MSELFAFRTASAVPNAFSANQSITYDALSQTTTYESGTPLLALHCTNHAGYPVGGRGACNAYGSYCTLYTWTCGHYTCDS